MTVNKHKHKLQGILFDWDNTIVDNHALTLQAKRNLFRRMHVAFPDNLSHYTASRRNLFRQYFPDKIAEANEVFDQELAKFDYIDLNLFPDVLVTLKILQDKNLAIGIVSNKRSDILNKEIEYFKMQDLFQVVVGSGDTEYDKPNPEPLLYAISSLQLDKKNVLFIGDSVIDFECASDSGCAFIGYRLHLDGCSFTTIDNHLALIDILNSEFLI
ncbi:MAG: HAD-superhydrolase, subIA, variant 1 family protein [Candidatus Xenolissoclinum pacificiensis L6]|uniref:phosphoglycolate phosphatase n=1 Tax=Candidatus Xenolissoclinum pacificiensis L6 TaxID=1401685 RepID=W2V1Y3_9RICK|nr:MAG: HAD-superhydrolase, subIA, variant 1 family protein [Candidatus Xenolissoclinum pacificiensis L6]